jgi:hypothetical protein
MSVHETPLFFRGKSDRNVMIAPLEGAEGAMGVVVYGNQGKGGMGFTLRYAACSILRVGLFLFLGTLPRMWLGVCDGVLQGSD